MRAGLAAVPDSADIVAVHDAARPLARPALWEAVLDAVVAGADGAIPAAAVTDTVKEVGPDGHLVTLDRSRLVAVQTPRRSGPRYCAGPTWRGPTPPTMPPWWRPPAAGSCWSTARPTTSR